MFKNVFLQSNQIMSQYQDGYPSSYWKCKVKCFVFFCGSSVLTNLHTVHSMHIIYCSTNPDIATSLISFISAGLKTCRAAEVCQLREKRCSFPLWYKHWDGLCGPKNGWRPQRLELQKQPHLDPTKDFISEFWNVTALALLLRANFMSKHTPLNQHPCILLL